MSPPEVYRRAGRRPPPKTVPVQVPTLAFFVVFLGGVFVLVDGLLLLGAGATAFTVGYAIPPADVGQLGGLGVAVGVAILAVGFLLHENVDQRRSAGALLIGLAFASLAAGGGFLVGFALTVVGALIGSLRR